MKDTKQTVDLVIVLIADRTPNEPVTCSTLKSRAPNAQYDMGWERTFGSRTPAKDQLN